ncbi:phosphotransferase [Nocardioides nitrophenolicus]|uniref:phosphotransferase n=1 Tax=Nocardioides nitrophenolicus TaxID=60489 RepID=UPI00195CD77B|nr:phosphotransferase [Nocardioides nitrophenolicus]MBM7520318.1 hypothetical protein [Nocardioides nitrophenolicus]
MSRQLLDDLRRDPSLVIDEARRPADRARILREVEGRQWAAEHGIPTAETVAVGRHGAWLVSRRLEDRPGVSLAYLQAALDVAQRIQHAPRPRLAPVADAWKAPRSAAVANAARLAAGGVSPREYVATRATAQRVPSTAMIHNDFHRDNVLDLGAGAGVAVIDWEFLTPGPPHRDFLQLLVNVRDDDLAHEGWELLLRQAPAAEHELIGRQFPWLALRTYASQLTAADPDRDVAQRAHNRKRWRQARRWSSSLRRPRGSNRP